MVGPKTEQAFYDTMIAFACGIAFYAVLFLAMWIGVSIWGEPATHNPLNGELVSGASACSVLIPLKKKYRTGSNSKRNSSPSSGGGKRTKPNKISWKKGTGRG